MADRVMGITWDGSPRGAPTLTKSFLRILVTPGTTAVGRR